MTMQPLKGLTVVTLEHAIAAPFATPVAGVTPQIDDEQRLLADLAWSRRHGFGAKLCIHPRQVAPIHTALAPSTQAIAWAQRVLAAEVASPGAAQLDGRMIDRPVVLQAQRTLQRGGG
jgi:citrate lyase subunit beta / citryl-CoA lyase